MSDFLTRLAGRSMGLTPVVQPVIPAMTAPASRDAALTERETFREASEEREETNRDAPQVPPAWNGSVRQQPPETQFAAATQTRRDTGLEPTVERPSGSRPSDRPRLEASLDSTLRLPGIASDDMDHGDPALPGWGRTHPDSAGTQPSPAAAGISTERRRTAPAEAPAIRVTIGRVEVRAEFSSPKARHAAAPRPKASALSLDDYLKQRGEGRR